LIHSILETIVPQIELIPQRFLFTIRVENEDEKASFGAPSIE